MADPLLDSLKQERDRRSSSPETRTQSINGVEPLPERGEQGFSQRLAVRAVERKKLAHAINQAAQDGEQGWTEAVFQLVGQVGAGFVLDAIGETLVSGARGISNITPDIVENPIKDGVSWAAHKFLDTPIGQKGLDAAMSGFDAWQEFARENPRSARNISSVVNIALLAAPVKGKVNPTAPSAVGRTGDRIIASGTRAGIKNKNKFVEKLVRPSTTLKNLEKEVPRTKEVGRGVLRRNVVELSPSDKAAADAVKTVKGISKDTKTIQGSYDKISSAVSQESNALLSALSKRKIPVAQTEIDDALSAAMQTIKTDTLLTGDAARVAERIIKKAGEIAAEQPASAAGLLKTRRALDAWVRRQKPRVFDAEIENASTVAVRSVRNSLNKLLERKAGPGVRKSLDRQSSLLRAMDNIVPKAAREENNVVFRAWQNLLSVLPIRGEFNQTMAAIFGIGGLGASALFAPVFTKTVGLGLFSYATGKAVMHPQTRKALGMMLKKIDEIVGKGTANPAVIRRLRADRAAIVEMIRTAEVSGDTPDQDPGTEDQP